MYCDERCKSCMYASVLSNETVVCSYLLVTGQRRRCPAGAECERYIKGERAVSREFRIWRGEPPKPKPKVDQREIKRKYRERTQALWQGRQHDVIAAYCQENKQTYSDIARKLGVSQTTVAYWAKEYCSANWDKLATLGIRKPELPEGVSA